MAQHRDNNAMKPDKLTLKEAISIVDEIIQDMDSGTFNKIHLVKALRDLSFEFYCNGKNNAIEIMERIAQSNLTADHIDRVINGQE